MNAISQEREVKFFVSDLSRLERRLQSLEARLVQPRTHEYNLRFDDSEGSLTSGEQVLRLRIDTLPRLTYKGPSRSEGGVRSRQEIEFIAGDYEAAKAFLEALGYQVVLAYEKWRAEYELEGVHIDLDELPYGDFVELEGRDAQAIRLVSEALGLDWSARAPGSYAAIFQNLKARKGLMFRDLLFGNFDSIDVTAKDLGLRPADEGAEE